MIQAALDCAEQIVNSINKKQALGQMVSLEFASQHHSVLPYTNAEKPLQRALTAQFFRRSNAFSGSCWHQAVPCARSFDLSSAVKRMHA